MRNETRQISRQKAPIRAQFAKDISTEAPIGGWNTRDAADNVPPEDAVLLDNFTCGLGAIRVRHGAIQHSYSKTVDGHTATAVKTLAKYDGGGTPQMIAADGGDLWVATIPGSKTTLEGAGGYASDIWSWTNFHGGSGPGYLVMVNGTDAIQYNGSTIATLSPALDDGAEGTINPIGCATFKNRMYYWTEGSQSVWYTTLYAHAGTVTEFPLGDVGAFGGAIIAVETWTHDGGHGIDDYIMFVMSSGEVLTYQGSYPEDEADWAIVGVYRPGKAMGPRCFAKFGGDLYMMTDLDIIPMSQLLAGAEQNRQRTKISGAMQAIAGFRGSFGFQAELFPPSKLMIFNVPDSGAGGFNQFVMNTVTGAWSRWKDLRANCWLEFEGKLFFGSDDGVVYEAENGFVDYRPAAETPPPTWTSEEEPAGRLLPLSIPYTFFENPTGGPIPPGQFGIDTDAQPWWGGGTHLIEANRVGSDGEDYYELYGLTIGTQFTLIAEDGTPNYTFEVTGPVGHGHYVNGDWYWARIPCNVVSGSGDFTDGEAANLTIAAVEPPVPGTDIEFAAYPIRSDVQTAWLRFGVEENKQFDAVKMFFRSGLTVPHSIGFATDYKNIAEFDYPPSVAAIGVPWSGEWDPDLEPVEIPDPTTWWTDEYGTNPSTPTNEVTGESGVGAVTKWGIEVVTTEKWEMIDGYGRAISMLMKLATTEQTDWNLTFWHLKLGARM